METSYIYSVSRTNALSEALLTKSDIERLFAAEPGVDLDSALKEVYLAPYILRTKTGDIAEALEQTLIDAKQMIHSIAPVGDMFHPLWIQYDVHNLRVFAKVQARSMSYTDVADIVSHRGIYEPHHLYEHAEKGTLQHLQAGWQDAFNRAVEYTSKGELSAVDGVFDALYFETSIRIAGTVGDAFMKSLVVTLIDLYNIKSQLRGIRHAEIGGRAMMVPGGNSSCTGTHTRESLFKLLQTYGGATRWHDAVTYYMETGHSTRFDARLDEYMIEYAHTYAREHLTFNAASLVEYYLKCRQSAANIRTIVVGKKSGVPEAEIRTNLRMAYVA